MAEGIQVRKRKDGSKSYRWSADAGRSGDGRRRWISGTCPTEKAAIRARREALNALAKSPYVKPAKMTLAIWLRQWIELKQGLSAKTRYRYNEIIEMHLIPALGNYELSKLRTSHLQAYYRHASQFGRRNGRGGLAAATVLHHHHVLSSALNDAVEDEEVGLAANPAARCKLGKAESPEMSVLNSEEVKRLLSASGGTPWHVPIALAVCTGCRRGEIAGLRWTDVDLNKGTVRIMRSLGQVGTELIWKSPKTESSRRTLKLPKIAVEILHREKAEQEEHKQMLGAGYQDNDLVCCLPNGQPMKPDSISHNFYRILKKAGVKRVRFHDLRHTAATLLLEQGADFKTVQARLGHRDARTTLNIYAHYTESMQQDAADKLDAALGEAE